MATIAELAQMANNVYNGTASASQNTSSNSPLLAGLPGWEVIDNSNAQTSKYWADGYFGVAYYNPTTQEVVIANRGTDWTDGSTTVLNNVQSDADTLLQGASLGQIDATKFAEQVVTDLQSAHKPYTSVIETGHSLGGNEAQAGVAYLVDNGIVPASQVSGVVFNSPGIGGYGFKQAASSYNVVDIESQIDIVHLAGGTHLGGAGNEVSIDAGPDALEVAADAALDALRTDGEPIEYPIAVGKFLAQTLGAGHSIVTQLEWLRSSEGAATGSFNWTSSSSASSIPGSPVESTAPTFSLLPDGSLVMTDPVSNISATLRLSPDLQTLTATFSGGNSAFAQELAGFGTVTIPATNSDVNFNNFAGATVVSESISRDITDPAGNKFDVVFYAGGSVSPPDPATALQFALTVTNPTGVFDYVLPAGGQTNIETIDNGVGNGTGSIVVLAAGATTLTGGAAVAGQSEVWTDDAGDQYAFLPGAPNSTQGTLTITGGVLGTTGNKIIIDNFDVAAAQTADGYLGIELGTKLSLQAGASSGAALPSVFPAGSLQFYTFSVNAPEAQAQSITFTLTGGSPSDFQAVVGDTTVQVGQGGRFTLTLAAGQTSLSFGLLNTTADNGQSDIAAGAPLQLTAEMDNPDNPAGIPLKAPTLNVSFTPEIPDTSHAPQTASIITGQYNPNTQITTYTGDGGNDAIAAGSGAVLINAQNSSDDVILGGTGKDTINGGSGNDVTNLSGSNDLLTLGNGFNTVNGGSGQDTIFGNGGNAIIVANGGTDLIFGGSGTNEIYAGAKVTVANAIAQTQAAAATSGQGDLLTALNGSNTVIGGSGNDLVEVGTGNDLIVLGSGNDTFLGGENVTNAQANWSTTRTPDGSGGFSLTVSGVTSSSPGFNTPYPQPYAGNEDATSGTFSGPGNDTVFAGNGNDLIALANGNSYVLLGSGSDTVWNGVGNDTIIAGSGADQIFGGGGNTYIVGGSGANTIWGGDGNNTIYGGSGNATILAAHGPGGINYINAGLEQNYVYGGSGNDLIEGSAGNDTLIAGSGNTTIVGLSGNENIVGGSGNDLLQAGSGNATIEAGGAGHDTLFGGNSSVGSYVLYGGNGTDALNGGSGANLIYAGDGGVAGGATSVFASESDSISSTTIYGGTGVDLLEGGVGTSVIFAGDGGTTLAPTTVIGGSGNDTIYGGPGLDLIEGGSGTNLLYAGAGGTDSAPGTVVGGAGISTLYGGEGPSVLQDLVSGQDLLVSKSADDSLIGTGNDTLVAGTGNDVLQANGGSVTFELNAGFGNDTIHTAGGTENIVFGTGVELANLTASFGTDGGGNWYLNLVDGSDGSSVSIQNAFTGGLGTVAFADSGAVSTQTLLTDVFGGDEEVARGSSNLWLSLGNGELVTQGPGSDTISSWGAGSTLLGGGADFNPAFIYSGGSSADIVAGVGTDSIVAAGSNSSIVGGANGTYATVSGANSLVTGTRGADVITLSGTHDTAVGGSGNSEFVVNDGSAVIEVAAGGGVDSIVSSVSYTLPTNVNVLALTGSANLSATANAANDSLLGGAGNDTLVAGSGLDTLIGGTGNTTFVINSTGDVVLDSSTTASNQINSSVSYTLPTDINTLVLTGTSGLIATANSGNDTLVSNSGVDTLIGGSGHDTFVISNSADVIELGTGTTTIIYESSSGYTLPTGALTLTLTGTANLVGTANGGNDTLVSNSGVDTLYGGSGNDTFVINNSADVVVDTLTTTSNTVQSSVSFSLPTDVSSLILTGSAALLGTGNSATDLLQANAGNDTLVSGTGVTTLVAGAGSDTFVVNNTGDVIHGVVQGTNDTLVSSVSYSLPANIDALVFIGTANVTGTANSDEDTLISNSGIDTLIGGSNNETYLINNSSDVIQDHSPYELSVVESSVSYTVSASVDALILTGTANIVGTLTTANDESLVGGAGQDTLIAASAFDTLVAGAGVSTLEGEQSFELFIVNNSADVVSLIGGVPVTDTIQSSVSYTLTSGIGTLELTGSANLSATGFNGDAIVANDGNDILYAGPGAETLVAGGDPDTLVGGTGPDTFVINSTADVLQGVSTVAGNQIVTSISYTLPDNINILTLSGSDNLIGVGNSGSDMLTGGAGTDTLVAGSGPTTLVAGTGNELFIIGSSADVVENTNTGAQAFADTIQSSVSYTLPTAVNILVLTGTANLTATGNLAADSIVGNAGLDTLTAGIGNDTLVAGSGLATLVGARGNDTFVVDATGDVVLDSLSLENNTLVSSVSYTLPTNVDTLLLMGSANLVATGNADNDSIKGNAGADTLVAGTGNDTLVAGSGPATLVGGAGNDTFVVNSSADVIESASSASANVIISSISFVLPVNINVLTLTGGGNDIGTGNGASDTLTGGAGNDTLVAGAGTDILIAGAGDTTFVVNNTADVVVDSQTTAANVVQSSVSYVLPTNVNTLILTGSGNLRGAANNGADTLISNGATDTLVGGGGNDTFVVNNTGDLVQDTAALASNTLQSSVSYSLVSNVNTLILTGTANLVGSANAANDTLVSNSGVDTLNGGGGNDTFIVSNAGDVVQDTASAAQNTLVSSVSYTLPTNVNSLTLTGTASLLAAGNGANDIIRANGGSDTLVAVGGSATLVGGAGNDLFIVNNTNDVVQLANTNVSDTIQSSANYTLPTNVNTLVLTGAANLLGVANSSGDILVSNSGVDTLVAGNGPDVLVVNNSQDVLENVSANDTVESSVNYTLSGSADELILLGTAALYGTAGSGLDVLIAGSGNDTLDDGGGFGTATMIGGAGNDTFVVNNPNDVVQDTNGSGNNAVLSGFSYSLPANVDFLTLTGTYGQILTGNTDDNNVLVANSGADTLIAHASSNTLIGGSGADVIDAGGFDNLIYAGNGGTSVSNGTHVYGNANATNAATQSTIYGGSGYDFIFGGYVSDLIVTGSGTSQVTGGSGNETIVGTSGTNQLDGGTGTNLIYGGAGTSFIEGDGSINVLYAGAGGTTASPETVEDESQAATTQSTIYGGSGVALLYGGYGGDLIYGGTGIDTLYSGHGANSLYGATGDLLTDSLSGGQSLLVAGAGAETLAGEGGDTLVAGTGSDIMYDGTASSVGSLYEFNPGFGQATIGNLGSANDTIQFGAGIEPGDLSVGVVSVAGSFRNRNGVDPGAALGLVINDGTGSIVVEGGFIPGTLDTLEFADGTTETVAQLLDAANPGLLKISDSGYTEILNTNNGQTLVGGGDVYGPDGDIFDFGNDNNITLPLGYFGGAVYAYGNNDTIATSGAWLGGNDDLVTISNSAGASLAGANDTVVATEIGLTYFVGNSTDVIEAPAGQGLVDAAANYTLTQGLSSLVLVSSVGGLTAGVGTQENGILEADGNNDTLYGGSGQNGLTARGSNDVLVGGPGVESYGLYNPTDSIVFGSGDPNLNSVFADFNYTLGGGANNLVVAGTSRIMGTANDGNDYISATSFEDANGITWYGGQTLVGGSGNDTLDTGQWGDVTLIGGSGNDTFILDEFGNEVIDNYTTGSNLIELIMPGTGVTLPTNVNSLQLLANQDIGVANNANDLMTAYGQFDTLVGGSGTDTLISTRSENQLTAGSGNTSLVSAGSDTMVAGAGNDTFVGSGGADTIQFNGAFGADLVENASNSDVIRFGAGITPANVTFSILTGAAGAPPALGISYSGGGTATVQGGLFPGHIADIVFANGATLTVPQALSLGRQTLAGGEGNLLLTGSNNDSLVGGAGQDTLYAWGNGDTLTAGSGGTLIYADGTGDLAQGDVAADTLVALGSGATLVAGTGTDSLVADGVNALLVAGSGTDVLTANGQNATLEGGSGTDSLVANTVDTTLIGGSGNESFVINNGGVVVEVTAGVGNNIVYSSVGGTVPDNVTDMVLTGSGAVGVSANSGNDSIVGNAGYDGFIAGSGIDTFVGGTGGGVFSINSSADVVSEQYSGTGSEVRVAFNYTLPANVDVLSLMGSGITGTGNNDATNVLINNSSGAVTLIGGSGADSLVASKQQVLGDVLISGTGVDTLVQGYNETTYVINNSQDVIQATEGGDTIETSVNYDLAQGFPNVGGFDTWNVLGSANLVASDSSGSNIILTGNAGNDILEGGSGQNQLIAGTGVDTLIGGGVGSDNTFTINNSLDVIVAHAGAESNFVFSTVSYSLPANVSDLLLESSGLVATGGGTGGVIESHGGDTLVGSAGADILDGASHDTLVAGTGQTSINAGTSDTIILNQGFGNAVVANSSGSAPLIIFGTGIADANLTVGATLDQRGQAALTLSDGAGTAILDGALAGTSYSIMLPDGSVVTPLQALQELTPTTSSAVGANGNFIFEGTPSVAITGGSGNDTIYALGASDTITAGSGTQTLIAFGTNESMVASTGNDQLSAQGSGDTLVAGSGSDTLVANSSDTVLVNSGFGNVDVSAPTVTFGAGITPASLTAAGVRNSNGAVALTLAAGTGTLTLNGALSGTDYQFAFADGETPTLQQLLGEISVATSSVAGSAGNFIFDGNPNISLAGGTGADTIYVAAQNDTIVGGNTVAQDLAAVASYDSIVGGNIATYPGNSLFAYGNYDTMVSGTGSDIGQIYGNNAIVISGSGSNSTFFGYAYGNDNSLVGGSGSDQLVAYGSGDTLVASQTNQELQSNGGNTTFVVNNSADFVEEAYVGVSDTVQSSVSFSLPANVDTLVLTGTASLTAASNSQADTLVSNSGVDVLAAGSGSDLFVINNTADTITFGTRHGTDTIESSVSFTLPTNVTTLILTGTNNLAGTVGNTTADLVVANSGSDTLTASGTAATTLKGGGGNDTFFVVNSHDVVSETHPGVGDLIISTVSYTLAPNVSALILSGTGPLAATGGTQNSVLTAAAIGTDTLTAGVGLATLNGGGGNDIFVVNNTGDVVNVTATGVTDTIQATVNYVLPANVIKLTLEGGTTALSAGTTNGLNDTLTANSGNDTLIAGITGADSLVGGAGADLFIIDNTADIVSVGASHGIDTIQSSVSVTAPANVASITLTGSAPLSATGSATQAGVLTAGSGNDTLTALDSLVGSGATLLGGAGNDVFSINNSADVISDTYTSTTNTLMSSVSYTLPTNVNILTVTGSAAVVEHGNSANDSMTANNAADTLVAGNGTDTLVSGTGIDSLVGGTGTDLFFVNNAADIVTVGTGGAANDTISSSVSFTLSPNVQYLTLTGTGTVSGTGNSLTDLIVGNTGTDTLTGGTGIAVLEGGTGTAAHDTLKAPSAQAALIAGSGTSTLTGGAFKDFYGAAGTSQSITTGATANVIAINKGDGATTFVPTTGASDVFSLGAGIDTESLTFTKSGTTGLILSDGSGDSITLTNWFTSTNNQDVKTLQVVEQASASYNASSTDALHNKPLEEFNFTALVATFTADGSTAGWTLSTGMPAAAITSSATAAYGGDLAYYFGLNGNLTGMNLSAAQSTLTNSSFATAAQTIDSWSSISGGSGLHLLEAQPPAFVDPIHMQWMKVDTSMEESTGLGGSEAELDTADEAVTPLLAGAPGTPLVRRTIESPRAHTV